MSSQGEKLEHDLHNPARTIGIVPDLVEQSLLSGRKFADAGYISIYDENEVNIYDLHTTKIVVSEAAVLKRWRCPIAKLWRISLRANIRDLNLKQDTLVLDTPNDQESLNSLYTVHISKEVCNHI